MDKLMKKDKTDVFPGKHYVQIRRNNDLRTQPAVGNRGGKAAGCIKSYAAL